MTAPASSPTSYSAPFSRRRLVVIAAGAVIANLIVFAIGNGLGASMIATTPDPETITVMVVAIGSFVPLVLIGLITWPIARRAPALRIWAAWIGATIAVLSIAEPLLLAQDFGTGVTLSTMHLFVGVAWFLTLMTGRSKA